MTRWYAMHTGVGSTLTTERYGSPLSGRLVELLAPDKATAQAMIDARWGDLYLKAQSVLEWEEVDRENRTQLAQDARLAKGMSDAARLAMGTLQSKLGMVPLLACAMTLLPNQTGLLDRDAGKEPAHTTVGKAVRRAVNSQRYALVPSTPPQMVVAVQLNLLEAA